MANDLNMRRFLSTMDQRKRSLMRALGNNSKNFFQIDNFDSQGFIDDSVQKWKPVKTKLPGQRIGIESGRMRRSFTSRVTRPNRAEVSVNVNYASFFNRTRKLVGNSSTLDRQNRNIIERHYNAIFR